VLDLDPVLARLRERIREPAYIRELARRLLLDNPHRVRLVMVPDRSLSRQRRRAEEARLAAMHDSMDDTARAATVRLAADLQRHQQRVDDDSLLPRVELADVPAGLPDIDYREHTGSVPITCYARGTNGIVYQQLIAPMPALHETRCQLAPLYAHFLAEVGMGDLSYLQAQERQAATVGSIHGFTTMRGSLTDEQLVSAHFNLSSKALLRNSGAQARLMRDVLYQARFDETARLRDLVMQQLARREQSITSNGHGLAMAAACAGMSPLADLHHRQSGLAGIRWLRELDRQLATDAGAAAFAAELPTLHSAMQQAPVQLLAIAEEHHLGGIVAELEALWSTHANGTDAAGFHPEPLRERRAELWLANTQVNFCARAYPTVPGGHADAAALTVLGGFLRNGFLHTAIRERGGAYGGGASQDSGIAAFRFYSYRDPRLGETLADFDAALPWILDNRHDPRALEEAILGVIASIDRPSSPAGEAKQHFHNRLYGRTHAQREQFRERVMSVTLEDLRRVAGTYLLPDRASTAVLVPRDGERTSASLCSELDLSLQTL